ncbi:hypothetical protein CDO52_16390 [Nocardiopsis gilva YIM 90087]|uniref:SWIM-type domain-containing protein n=1 Tax=Nocardiopsis gilva YIM 90087 TaxID=1235441 RepID=A0A223S7S5_9ACTN|nr:SWIM zinc finger family protein [Nocardiopsis gilva]ASU84156.1 hypothetical protein CDO52_16390 [Nocardiopsis gilva YIM 90087]
MSRGDGELGRTGGAGGGRSWWSNRFVEAVESGAEAGRLERGRGYAARGAVRDVKVAPGEVLAKVQGSRARPYRVSLILPTLDEERWSTVIAALAGQPLFRARLLAGDLPPEVERVFEILGIAMFPRGLGNLTLTCCCPDWGYPCKHVAAALYVLADSLDSDPFLLLAWLGKERGAFLSELRRHAHAAVTPEGRSDAGTAPFEDLACPTHPALPPLPETATDFWSAPELPARPMRQGPPQPVVLTTDPPGDDERALARELEPLYERLIAPENP